MTITIKDLKQRAKENGYIAFESDESLLFLGRASTNEENKIILNKKDNSILEYNVTFSGDRDFDMLAAVKEYVDSVENEEQDEEIEERGGQMTYKELKKIAKKNGYEVDFGDDRIKTVLRRGYLIGLNRVTQYNEITISEIEVNRLWVEISTYSDDKDVNMLEAAMAYAKKPIGDRGKEKRYIIPLPGLVTTDGRQQYLTHKNGQFFASRRNKDLRQTWKEEHLCYVPEQYRIYAVEWKE